MTSDKQSTTTGPGLLAILLIRLGVLWLLVLVSVLIPNDAIAFYAFMGIAFIITVPYSLWLREKMKSHRLASLQFIVDLVLVTGLIYYTGGLNSNLTLLYPLIILSAGIVSTPKQAAKITVLGILVYAWMVAMLSQHILVEYLPGGDIHQNQSLIPSVFLRILTFTCFGLLSIYISQRCSYKGKPSEDPETTAEKIFMQLNTNILILDAQGQILLANPAACKTLNRTKEDLLKSRFVDLHAKEQHPLDAAYGATAYLERPDLSPLPISYETTIIQLYKEETAAPVEQTADPRHTALSFQDISRSVDLDRQLKQIERITAATEIAGEMAHEIRTPLTSISASVQLLRHYEDKATAADWLPNSPRRKDRVELFEHIMLASEQMDSVIKNFVDFAEFSPADLLSIIKLDYNDENKGYIGQLNTTGRGFTNGQDSDSGRRSDNTKFIE